MPVLDAKALKTDPKGLAFLKAVLRSDGAETKDGGKPAETRPAKPSDRAPNTATPR